MTERAERAKPKAPTGLKATGRGLWRRITTVFELEVGELAVLELACRQADDVADLEEQLRTDGLVVEGSAGQPRLNAVVAELRQGRLAVGKLLGQIALLDDDGRPATEGAKRARHAADRRWAAQRVKAEERRAHGAP